MKWTCTACGKQAVAVRRVYVLADPFWSLFPSPVDEVIHADGKICLDAQAEESDG